MALALRRVISVLRFTESKAFEMSSSAIIGLGFALRWDVASITASSRMMCLAVEFFFLNPA